MNSQIYLYVVFGADPPNNLERVISLGGAISHIGKCSQVMTKLGSRGEQIMLLHHTPRLHSNLHGYTKKSPKALVFGHSWRKNAECIACAAHHLLSLTISLADRGNRLRVVFLSARKLRVKSLKSFFSNTYHCNKDNVWQLQWRVVVVTATAGGNLVPPCCRWWQRLLSRLSPLVVVGKRQQ